MLQQMQLSAGKVQRTARVSMSKDVSYSGSLAEYYGAWIRKVNDEAMAEGWTPDEKRRAAALTRKGAASIWHNELGHHIFGWDAWEAA